MRNLDDPGALKRFDAAVLKELKRLRRLGQPFARAGAIARKLSCDSVQALGAMLRVAHEIKSH